MLYIIVTQIDVSLKENMLINKKDVDSKDVYDTKKCVYHRHLLTTRNTKKCVCLKNNKSWLENVKEEKRCWVIFESNLSQISTKSWLVLINSDAFITQDEKQRAKEKNENSTSIYMNRAKSRLDNSSIDLRLQKFAHMIEIIETELLRLN